MRDEDKAKLKVIYLALADGFGREIMALDLLTDIAGRVRADYSAEDEEVLRSARDRVMSVRDEVCTLFEKKLTD